VLEKDIEKRLVAGVTALGLYIDENGAPRSKA